MIKENGFENIVANKNTMYFNVTANKKLAMDIKKYLDYRWESRIDPDDIDLNDLFAPTAQDDIEVVKYPHIQDYFVKDLERPSNLFITDHHKFMQIEDKIYMKIDVIGEEDEPYYNEEDPRQHEKMIGYLKRILDCIGIDEIEYIIVDDSRKRYLFL